MKVYIESDVINSSDKNIYRVLDIIFLSHFWEERHLWIIDDIYEVMGSAWFQYYKDSEAYKTKCDDLKKIYTKAIYSPNNSRMHSIKIRITLSGNDSLSFTPDEVRTYLDKPLHVIVENAESDGAFIKAMISAFDRKEMQTALSNGWWKIEHAGGGGEITKRAKEILKDFPKVPRIFILIDSDREYSEHEKDGIKELEKYCTDKEICFHILNKREIENYLPIDILSQVIKKYEKVYATFSKLSQEQRDYYDMKKGF